MCEARKSQGILTPRVALPLSESRPLVCGVSGMQPSPSVQGTGWESKLPEAGEGRAREGKGGQRSSSAARGSSAAWQQGSRVATRHGQQGALCCRLLWLLGLSRQDLAVAYGLLRGFSMCLFNGGEAARRHRGGDAVEPVEAAARDADACVCVRVRVRVRVRMRMRMRRVCGPFRPRQPSASGFGEAAAGRMRLPKARLACGAASVRASRQW